MGSERGRGATGGCPKAPSVTRENPKETPSPAAARGTRQRASRMSGTPRTTCWPWSSCFATMDARRPRRCPRPSMTTTCQSRRRGDEGERTFAMARKNRGKPVPRGRDRDARAAWTSTRASEMTSHRARASTSASAGVLRRRLARRRGASGSTLPGIPSESPGRVWRKRAGTRPIRARARRARVTASEGDGKRTRRTRTLSMMSN